MAMERENRAPRAGGPNRKRKKVCQSALTSASISTIRRRQAAPLHLRAFEDPAPQNHRYLRDASASADRGHQARPADRPAALRHRLRQTVTEQRLPHPLDGGAFLLQSQFFYAIYFWLFSSLAWYD